MIPVLKNIRGIILCIVIESIRESSIFYFTENS